MFEWLDTEPRSSFGTALTQIPPGSRTLHHYSPPALLSFAAAAGKCKVDSGIWEFVGFCLAALHQSEVWALWTLWRRGRLSSPHQTTWGLHRQTDGRSLPGALLWKPRRTERSRQARWVREPTGTQTLHPAGMGSAVSPGITSHLTYLCWTSALWAICLQSVRGLAFQSIHPNRKGEELIRDMSDRSRRLTLHSKTSQPWNLFNMKRNSHRKQYRSITCTGVRAVGHRGLRAE